jgi:signal transduction histidine kinase
MRCSTSSLNRPPIIDTPTSMQYASTDSNHDAADVRHRLGTLRELIGYLDRQHQHQSDKLAAQVHAQLGSAVTALTMRLALLARQNSATHDAANHALQWEKVNALLTLVTENTRDLQRQLRPFAIDALGFSSSLSDALQQFGERHGIITSLCLASAAPDWSADDAHAVVRIVQEALRNIAQHAQATKVILNLNSLASGYEVEIIDDGVGFDLAALDWHRSHGLRLMRERAALLHAHLDITSAPGEGCRIRLALFS